MQFQPKHVQQVYSNPQVNENYQKNVKRQNTEEDGDCSQGFADCCLMFCRIFLCMVTLGLGLLATCQQ